MALDELRDDLDRLSATLRHAPFTELTLVGTETSEQVSVLPVVLVVDVGGLLAAGD